MQRVEMALYAQGFSGENTIAMSNLCRDELTIALKDKIDVAFGWSFNTVGIGGVLTCGVSGLKAGLSHSPVTGASREKYIFFSMPHIAIDAEGKVGIIERPGRPGESCACGALIAIHNQLKKMGVDRALERFNHFEEDDPEVSKRRTFTDSFVR
jgi:hypothetical protein